ncbi:unnamed protein product, partial [Effrenium voratum]
PESNKATVHMASPTSKSGGGKPEGLPQLVPDEAPSRELAPGVADCVANPLQAQYAWDSINSLIETCRRVRMKNWQAVSEFPRQGPFFEGMPKGSSSETVTGA